MRPSTLVLPREGSFALAVPGSVRNVQEGAFAEPAGRKSGARKRIFGRALHGFGSTLLMATDAIWFRSSRKLRQPETPEPARANPLLRHALLQLLLQAVAVQLLADEDQLRGALLVFVP